MATDRNVVELTGHLAEDPGSHADGDGSPVAVLQVAVTRPEREGVWVDEADLVVVIVRGQDAEEAAQTLTKDRRVGIVGRLRQRTWDTPQGPRSRLQVEADQVHYLDPTEPLPATAGPAAGDPPQPPAARPDGQATEVVIEADGGCRGNPGPAGYGVVITAPSAPVEGEAKVREALVLAELSEGIGWSTNNLAEYRAVIAGLEHALTLGARVAHVRSDSRLVVDQLNGRAKVNKAPLQSLRDRAMELVAAFERVTFERVGRDANARADALANQAMDQQGQVSDPANQAAEAGSTA